MDHPKRYLVTGGAGHLGSHLVEALLDRGDRVVVLDDLSTGQRENVSEKAEFIEGSVLDIDTLVSNDVKLDGIFHLAAFVNVRESTKQPKLASASGCNLTVAALEFARARRVSKLVFVSSVVVQFNPHIPYGIEKSMGERYCQYYNDELVQPTSVVRLHSVYGSPRHDVRSGNVIPAFLEQKKQTGRIRVSGDGSQVRDFVYYTDAIAAILSAENRAGVSEVGSTEGRSILEVAKQFDCPIDFIPVPPGEVDEQVCQRSDYPTSVSFEEGMRKTLHNDK